MSMHHRSRLESHSVYPRSANPAKKVPKKQVPKNPYEAAFFEGLTDFILLSPPEGESDGLYTVVSLIACPVTDDEGKTKMLYPIRQFKNRWSSVYDNNASKKWVNDHIAGKGRKEQVDFYVLGEAGRLTVLDFVEVIRPHTRRK